MGQRIHWNVPLYKVVCFFFFVKSLKTLTLVQSSFHNSITLVMEKWSKIPEFSTFFLIQKRFPKQGLKTVVKNVSPWSSWTLFSHLTLPRNSYLVFGNIRFFCLDLVTLQKWPEVKVHIMTCRQHFQPRRAPLLHKDGA